jgi:hypothetical protein
MDKLAAEKVVQTYLDACYEGSGDKMREVFHQDAHLFSIDDRGNLVNEPRDDFAKHIDDSISPQSQGAPREDEIVFLDFSGPRTALAKVNLLVGDIIYTDYLMLGKVGNDWKILSKMYVGKKK